jgi:hypothetical protein
MEKNKNSMGFKGIKVFSTDELPTNGATKRI